MYRRFVPCVASAALVIGTMPAPLAAQPAPAPVATPDQTEQGEQFSTAQLEALLAPVALYPDSLLTQLLMATTNPLEIVAASRWLAQGSNRELTGKALEDALRNQPWDPAVKSLVPFPQVLEMLNQQLEWTQQLGYAMQNQEAEVFDAIQRLRTRAQSAGTLQSTPQQIVRTEAAPPPPPGATDPRQQNIIIDPADPNVVYVPSYDPSQVYGAWPYADVPPVYYAPLPGYGYPGGLVAGLVFGVGVAIAAAALWGWARPNWGCCWGGRYGGVNVNANRWNAISPTRPWRGGGGGVWHANNPGLRPGGGMGRPGGPVGRPVRPGGPPGVVRPGIPPGVPPGGHRPGVPGSRDCCPVVRDIVREFPEFRGNDPEFRGSDPDCRPVREDRVQPPCGAARSGRWEPACAWSRHSTRHSATRQAGDRATAAAPECATGADCATGTDYATGAGADCAARPRTKASCRTSGSAADGRWPSRRGRGRPRGRQASLRDAFFASNRSGDLPASPAVTVT
jgi:hypothetical protein